ncbi:MAG: hypothetical protein OER90_04405 [Gemmatimonadota bacterium]|nr:hypothetical protein [Gemmatimonadota bacterium]
MQEREREILFSIRDAAAAGRAVVTARIDDVEGLQRTAARFYYVPDADLAALPTDSIQEYLFGLMRPGTEGFARGELAGIVTSGQVTLVRDNEVRAALDDWLLRVSELEERAQALVSAGLSVMAVLTQHESIQERVFSRAWLGKDPGVPVTPRRSWDARAIRADPALKSAAAVMTFEREVYLDNLEQLAQALDEIRELVAASQDDPT